MIPPARGALAALTGLPRSLAQAPARTRAVVWALGAAALVASVWLVWRGVDRQALATAWRGATADPATMAVVLAAFGSAFVLRALAWRRVMPGLPLGHALAAIHVALAGNHVLPLRLGEPLRVTSAVGRAGVPLDATTASTVTLRAVDVLALVGLAVVLAPSAALGLMGAASAVVATVLALVVAAAGVVWLRRAAARPDARVRAPDAAVVAAAVAAWMLEAAVVWQVARWAGAPLALDEALLVSVLAVVGQLAAVAPGGFGTYEAAATAALAGVGVEAGTALAIALTAHALKTAYALAAGAVAAVVPAPGIAGRLRLPDPARRPPPPAAPAPPSPEAPVVLFLPAHDEAATVADVVARAPATVRNRAVRCLVVDDGSRDDTAARAARAGAQVVALGRNRGLGAAVRAGLAAAGEHDPAAVAFCDADGEYAPEELDRLVGPILDGAADYVVGSRFAGRIGHMRPHRRFGNRVLTRVLAFVAREPVSDGQSGYRALSPAAARAAEVSHDYNYAQVLTLDLLAKGYRYAEVPISYRFRTTGRSFVRLGRYLRAVVPAVWRLVNRPSVLDDVGAEGRP